MLYRATVHTYLHSTQYVWKDWVKNPLLAETASSSPFFSEHHNNSLIVLSSLHHPAWEAVPSAVPLYFLLSSLA